MALRTFVLVSGVNNLSDARYCAGMEVNQLGFNVEPEHPNYTDPEKFREIADWISGVELVAELTASDTNMEFLTVYDVQAIRIEHANQLSTALNTGYPVIFTTSDIESARQAWWQSDHQLAYVLYTGMPEVAAQLVCEMPVVLTKGITAETVNHQLDNNISLKGIGLQGGNEIRPGFRNFDTLADILEAVEIDDLD